MVRVKEIKIGKKLFLVDGLLELKLIYYFIIFGEIVRVYLSVLYLIWVLDFLFLFKV